MVTHLLLALTSPSLSVVYNRLMVRPRAIFPRAADLSLQQAIGHQLSLSRHHRRRNRILIATKTATKMLASSFDESHMSTHFFLPACR